MRDAEIVHLVLSLTAELDRANEQLKEAKGLLDDPQYLEMKVKYHAGQLSWANMIEERERKFMEAGQAAPH